MNQIYIEFILSTIKIQDIYIYPVKSLGGIRLEQAVLEERGLQHDRRWMLVDENNRFLSQREMSQLTLFTLSQHNSGFKIQARFGNEEEFDLPFQIQQGEIIQVTVWDDVCPAIEYAEGSSWFTKQIKQNCKLVYMPDTSNRYVDKQYASKNEIVSFSDGYPLLLIGQESLDDLNKRLQHPIGMERFRPNLVASGGRAFEEDNWKQIRINGIDIEIAKPCARCVIPSINPATAQIEKEPNASLSKYRLRDNKIYFGQNLLPKSVGLISCNDKIHEMELLKFN